MNRDDILPPPKPRFTEQELAGYSITRAFRCALDGSADGLEKEVHDELARASGPTRSGGFLTPTDGYAAAFEKRGAHEVATASKGGELVYRRPGSFIDVLAKLMALGRLGATFLDNLPPGDFYAPRATSRTSPSWQAESQVSDTTVTAMTFDGVLMSPKEVTATTDVTRKLLRQSASSAAIDRILSQNFVRGFAVEFDRVGINGLGTGNEPTGILATSGIGSVVGGTNGIAPTYDHCVDLEYEVGVGNADLGALGFLTTSQIRKRLRKAAKISAASGVPVWVDNKVLDYLAIATQNVPSALSKGTSTTACSAIIFGNFEELLLGSWGAVEIVIDPYSQARRGDVKLTGILYADVGLRHAPSMAAMLDALN